MARSLESMGVVVLSLLQQDPTPRANLAANNSLPRTPKHTIQVFQPCRFNTTSQSQYGALPFAVSADQCALPARYISLVSLTCARTPFTSKAMWNIDVPVLQFGAMLHEASGKAILEMSVWHCTFFARFLRRPCVAHVVVL